MTNDTEGTTRRRRLRPRNVVITLIAALAIALVGAKLFIEFVWKTDPKPAFQLDPITPGETTIAP